MTEGLEQLKTRAKERRDEAATWKYDDGGRAPALHEEAEADLDRAIVIAEERQQAFNLMMDARVDVSVAGLQEARADVLMLREMVRNLAEPGHYEEEWSKALADTEHYESNADKYAEHPLGGSWE